MVIEARPREIGFVLWGHCQNLLDDPRMNIFRFFFYFLFKSFVKVELSYVFTINLVTIAENSTEK